MQTPIKTREYAATFYLPGTPPAMIVVRVEVESSGDITKGREEMREAWRKAVERFRAITTLEPIPGVHITSARIDGHRYDPLWELARESEEGEQCVST